jgi:hypothetical protein
MNPAHPVRPSHPDSSFRRERLFLSLCLVSLLLLVAILGSFHHHHDLAAHPDCPVCAFIHHADATAPAGPTLITITLPVLPVLLVLRVLTPPTVGPALQLRSRAPPQ